MTPEIVTDPAGVPLFRFEGRDRKGLRLTLLHRSGGARREAEAALSRFLDAHWPE